MTVLTTATVKMKLELNILMVITAVIAVNGIWKLKGARMKGQVSFYILVK